MILIEDAFTGVEFRDDDGDQIEVVGDLIRHIEGNERIGSPAATLKPKKMRVVPR
jgi:hypothetical protein